MNRLDQLAPWVEQLGANSLKAIPLILLLFVAQKWARRWITPRGMMLLWSLVLIRLFMPEIAATPASIYNLLKRPPPLVAAPRATADYAAQSKPGSFGPVYSFTAPVPTFSAAPHPISAAPTGKGVPLTVSPSWSQAEIATAVWLAGLVMMMTLLAGQSWRFHRRFAGLPACADPVLLDLLEECRKEAGIVKPVVLIVSDAVVVPALYRLFRPRILLPVALTRSLDRAQLRCIFQHELAHVSGGDIAINWVVMAAVAIHWFNPFVWLMARSIAQVSEMACDRAVLALRSDPQVYGETIVRVAESLSRPQIVVGVAAIAETRNALKQRIRTLTQKHGPNAWLATAAAALVLGVLFLSSAVRASMAKTVPGLAGTGVSLADALSKADIILAGQVVGVKYEGTDSMMDRYWVKINVTRYLTPTFWFGTVPELPPPFEGEVQVTNQAFLANIARGDQILPVVQEKIPEDGQNYVFFISTDKKAKSNLIFKMLPAGLVIPNVIPGFPVKPATLEDSMADLPKNIVIGQFKKFKPSREASHLDGTKIIWYEENKTVIDVKKALRGDLSPGLIEGDFAYYLDKNLETGNGPRPPPPDLSKDYIFFLSAGGPSINAAENIKDPDMIFFLSPGRPSETTYGIDQTLPTDPLAQIKLPVVEPAPNLPLPGSRLSLDAAESDALSIIVGRVIHAGWEFTFLHGQFIMVEVHKVLRGKAQGILEFGYPLIVGRESPPKVGSEYVIFCSNNGLLKITPTDVLPTVEKNLKSELPLFGSEMTLQFAAYRAQTIVQGRVVSSTASALGTEFANYRDEVRIDQTFRGTAKGKIEVGFAIRNGKENAPGIDQDYIFYLNGDGDVLKIARYQ